jgi:hypothetical protein
LLDSNKLDLDLVEHYANTDGVPQNVRQMLITHLYERARSNMATAQEASLAHPQPQARSVSQPEGNDPQPVSYVPSTTNRNTGDPEALFANASNHSGGKRTRKKRKYRK